MPQRKISNPLLGKQPDQTPEPPTPEQPETLKKAPAPQQQQQKQAPVTTAAPVAAPSPAPVPEPEEISQASEMTPAVVTSVEAPIKEQQQQQVVTPPSPAQPTQPPAPLEERPSPYFPMVEGKEQQAKGHNYWWGYRDQQEPFYPVQLEVQQERTQAIKTPPSVQRNYQIDWRILPYLLDAIARFDGVNNGINAIIAEGLLALGYPIQRETLNQKFRWSDVPRIRNLPPEAQAEIEKRWPKDIDY